MSIVRVTASDVSSPDTKQLIDPDNYEIFQGHFRGRTNNPAPDNTDITLKDSSGTQSVEFTSGDDIVVDYEASYDLGSQIKVELLGIDLTVLSSQTSTSTSGSFTFPDISSDVDVVNSYIINGSGNRVSNRGSVQIFVDGRPRHPDLPSFADVGSEIESLLINIRNVERQKADLNYVADPAFSSYEALHATAQDIEEHVDLILGLGYSTDPLQTSDVTNATGITSSRLFPDGYTDTAPKEYSSFRPLDFSTSASNVYFYTNSESGRGPGDQSEYQDLSDAKTTLDGGATSVDVYDESRKTTVTYTTTTEIDDRQSEIVSIVQDFNADSGTADYFDERWFWVDKYVNKGYGYKTQANQKDRAISIINEDLNNLIETESTVEV